ncbi:MAG TPA: hypothetical protein VFH47_05095 [Candidatus Thermoplasmatota archaeon]|nr:hypothetical protein [Candidatus Thermoplasmatota archaeon]
MAGLLSGLFNYSETELDPAVQAEILLESARIEARVAILEIVLALLFGVWLDFFRDDAFRWVALFCLATVLYLLIDAQLRRSAAKRLLGAEFQVLPKPVGPVRRKT